MSPLKDTGMLWETDVQSMVSSGLGNHTSVLSFWQSSDEMSTIFKTSHEISYRIMCIFTSVFPSVHISIITVTMCLCRVGKGLCRLALCLGAREQLACRTRVVLLKVKHDWAYVWIHRMFWESSPTLSASFGIAACLVVLLSPSPWNEKSVLL